MLMAKRHIRWPPRDHPFPQLPSTYLWKVFPLLPLIVWTYEPSKQFRPCLSRIDIFTLSLNLPFMIWFHSSHVMRCTGWSKIKCVCEISDVLIGWVIVLLWPYLSIWIVSISVQWFSGGSPWGSEWRVSGRVWVLILWGRESIFTSVWESISPGKWITPLL